MTTEPKVLLVCGSRTWTDEEKIRAELEKHKNEGYTVLVHGDARGADRIADKAGKDLGYEVIACPADWEQFGRSAGFIRNRQMLLGEHGSVGTGNKVELVLAFHKDGSKGTAHTVRTAHELAIAVVVHRA